MLKSFVAFALFGVGCFLILVAVAQANSGRLIDHTIQNSRQLLADFKSTASFIEDFRKRRNRLPSEKELGRWGFDNGRLGYARIMDPASGNCGNDGVAKLGYPPKGKYLLCIWRGEWMEYYAPWSGRTTLSFDRVEYYTLGSAVKDTLLFGILAAASIFGSYFMWRTKSKVARKS